MLRGPRAPLWFVFVLAVAEALVWRYLAGDPGSSELRGGDSPDVQVAFWQLVLLVAGYVWQGIQIAGEITLKILAWSVKLLWAFAVAINNAAIAVGKALVFLAKQAWVFLRDTYTHVLRPMWEKFWNWFDRFRGWLDRTFGPIFRFLERIRKYVLDFYDKWVRPILDAIGIARKVLGVLSSLGLEWARALDRKLREIEEAIQKPFRDVVRLINEAIGVLNRVVTADGLFQRVALIRTIERDMRYIGRAFVNWRSAPVTPQQRDAVKGLLKPRPIEELRREAVAHIEGTGGPRAGLIREMVIVWTQEIERR